eukprot:gene4939-18441_t
MLARTFKAADGRKNLKLISSLFDALPSVAKMAGCATREELRELLDDTGIPLLYPLERARCPTGAGSTRRPSDAPAPGTRAMPQQRPQRCPRRETSPQAPPRLGA